MISFIAAVDNMPFTIALTVMLGIAILEGIGTVLGAGVSSILDSVVPDADIEVPTSVETHSLFSSLLGWLRAGNVPVLIILLIFLTSFGIMGLVVQGLFHSIFRLYVPWFIIIFPVFFAVLPIVRISSKLISKIVIKDETTVVSEESFIGQVATIVMGNASVGQPTQAKLHDRFGQVHYILVEPDNAETILSHNEQVLLVRHNGAVFKAIKAPSSITQI